MPPTACREVAGGELAFMPISTLADSAEIGKLLPALVRPVTVPVILPDVHFFQVAGVKLAAAAEYMYVLPADPLLTGCPAG